MRLLSLLSIILFLFAAAAHGQRSATVGFWNTENLFDTIPSIFYTDDADYTPGGKQSWNTERYTNKLANVARVIDHMSLDVIGLCEVENEGVVRDLTLRLSTDYNYIHRIAGRSRGRDVVLLYKGDKFVPHEVRTVDSRTSRTFLYVRGELCGERVDIVVVHLPSLLNKYAYRERAVGRLYQFVDSLHQADPDSRLIVMGDFNAAPNDRVMRRAFTTDDPACEEALFCPFETLASDGLGTYAHGNRWLHYDNIFLSNRLLEGAVRYCKCSIFIQSYMLQQDKTKRRGYPLRTFTGKKYTNGFSDHLPVFLQLTMDN